MPRGDQVAKFREVSGALVGAFALALVFGTDAAHATPILLTDFFADPTVAVAAVGHGYLGWMEIERQLKGTGVRSIPHNFGNGSFGTYASIVFGAASSTYVSLEDERILQHFLAAQPNFRSGSYDLPTGPGLGVDIDDSGFAPHAKHEFRVEA